MSKTKQTLISYSGSATSLHSATAMPLASGFLWNSKMLLQMNCRGYATAQFMQPEPAKYAYAPNLEAKTFMQPEQPYYAHHPGRFFYIKDMDSGDLFSVPYEPLRAKSDVFEFIAKPDALQWIIIIKDLRIELNVTLMCDEVVELWEISLHNLSQHTRNLSVTSYFPVGYMSWMNQSGHYDSSLQAIVCQSISPYQKYPDYFKQKDFKDKTYLLAETLPDSWAVRQSEFEGEGGLHAPSGLEKESLENTDAVYETPAAIMQYKLNLSRGGSESYRFAFGPALDEDEIGVIRKKCFADSSNKSSTDKKDSFAEIKDNYSAYINSAGKALEVSTPDPEFDHFVNHCLARQVFYHGDVNRLCTDPQTRNFLQDSMGLSYLQAGKTRTALLLALSQQNRSGAMPDGILLNENAELKYINQVPHMDHCVWLPICLSAYLEESNDYSILNEMVNFADSPLELTVLEHINLALRWLLDQQDQRGLNYIEQGDWCDPMNMVGYKGKGVSGWLSLATAYACREWAKICQAFNQVELAAEFTEQAERCNQAVNQHLWDGAWYARGITDDNIVFGVSDDTEGRIFLNSQTWAMLSGAANEEQETALLDSVENHLATPYGVQLLAPAFTKMREDIGRVTQKHPGSAENGSVYNHAAAFYSYALYQRQHADKAYQVLRQMIPGPNQEDLLQRGQMPIYIPNYYRGAYEYNKRTAGRSSQLFNTGTVHWFYRCLIDGLFGLQGCPKGLKIKPQLPSDWQQVQVTRNFRGARFDISIQKQAGLEEQSIQVDGDKLIGSVITTIEKGKHYLVKVFIPQDNH